MFNRKRMAALEWRIKRLETEVARLSDLGHREKLVLKPSRRKMPEYLGPRCVAISSHGAQAGQRCRQHVRAEGTICRFHERKMAAAGFKNGLDKPAD